MTKSSAPSPSSSSKEKVCKYISRDGAFRVSCVVATRVVDEMRSVLNSYPIATVALGRSLIGAVLMAAHQKEGHSVGMYFRGNGPLGLLFAESSYEGASRAYTSNPQLEMPLKNGLLDVGGAIGHGLLEVVRSAPVTQKLHSGTVIIKTGEIGEDIAYYLEQSQQIPSAVVLGVEVDEYGLVKGAGGMLVELFPGASEKVIGKIEEGLKKAGSISHMISGGATAEELVAEFLKGFELDEIDHNHFVRYECRCSVEKVKNALMLLGPKEIDDMIASGKDVEASCEFCGRRYSVTLEDLDQLRKESFKRSLN
jgi:molecular chaperone Hsp33